MPQTHDHLRVFLRTDNRAHRQAGAINGHAGSHLDALQLAVWKPEADSGRLPFVLDFLDLGLALHDTCTAQNFSPIQKLYVSNVKTSVTACSMLSVLK